jgi:hypothetical protein
MAAVRGRGPDPLPRALAVVALVAVAALALQARQGLDWDALAEPLDVRWSRLVVGAVLLLALVGYGRRLLRRLRRPRRPASTTNPLVEPEGQPIPWYLRVLAVALVLATMGVIFFVVSSLGPIPRPAPPPPAAQDQSSSAGQDANTLGKGGTSPVALVVVGALLVAAVASRWHSRRPPDETPEEGEDRAAVRRLVRAVDAAEEELARHADPREAVLAAYAAMARHLSTGLVRRGGSTPGSDTATELLDRSVAAGLLSGASDGPARALTDLFREARFSDHPMGEASRQSAESCLRQVRAELGAHRA